MRISGMVIDKICGIALLVLCVLLTIFSIKVCDGDITPIFILAPIAVCSMSKGKKV